MKHAPNMTDHTINRGGCSLRTNRPVLIRISTRQKPGVRQKNRHIVQMLAWSKPDLA